MENLKTEKAILSEICQASSLDLTLSETKEALESLNTSLCNDFYFEVDGEEWRILEEDAIDDIWTDSLIEMVKDCYDLSEVPSFVTIDWEQTAANCKVDGAGHHFSTYDGNEYTAANYFLFRTN